MRRGRDADSVAAAAQLNPEHLSGGYQLYRVLVVLPGNCTLSLSVQDALIRTSPWEIAGDSITSPYSPLDETDKVTKDC